VAGVGGARGWHHLALGFTQRPDQNRPDLQLRQQIVPAGSAGPVSYSALTVEPLTPRSGLLELLGLEILVSAYLSFNPHNKPPSQQTRLLRRSSDFPV
jgi:hypothetical protein